MYFQKDSFKKIYISFGCNITIYLISVKKFLFIFFIYLITCVKVHDFSLVYKDMQ